MSNPCNSKTAWKQKLGLKIGLKPKCSSAQKNGVYAVFDEEALPYLKEKDRNVLQIASCDYDTSRYLKEFSPELKDCLLAISGEERFAGHRSWFSMSCLDFSLPCVEQRVYMLPESALT